jgi:hypothetical protein
VLEIPSKQELTLNSQFSEFLGQDLRKSFATVGAWSLHWFNKVVGFRFRRMHSLLVFDFPYRVFHPDMSISISAE